MKKFLCITTIFVLLFSTSCSNKINEEMSSTSSITEKSTSVEPTLLPSETVATIQQTSGSGVSTTETLSDKSTDKSDDSEQNVGPMIISATLDELKRIKELTETISPEDFAGYMEKNEPNLAMNGFHDYDNSKMILDDLLSATIPLLDNNTKNFAEVSFYWESNHVQQLILLDEDKRISVNMYTPKSTRQKTLQLGDEANIVLSQPVENDLYVANLYVVENDEHFYADVSINDSYIVLRSKNIQTLEEFEVDFARLSFVKIGDLIK